MPEPHGRRYSDDKKRYVKSRILSYIYREIVHYTTSWIRRYRVVGVKKTLFVASFSIPTCRPQERPTFKSAKRLQSVNPEERFESLLHGVSIPQKRMNPVFTPPSFTSPLLHPSLPRGSVVHPARGDRKGSSAAVDFGTNPCIKNGVNFSTKFDITCYFSMIFSSHS